MTIVQPGGYPTKIWKNAQVLSGQLKTRLSEDHLKAYPETSGLGADGDGGSRNTDPMDIPRITAAMIAMEAGARPLRKAVHPFMRPQEPINEISAKQQHALLGLMPQGKAMQEVLD